MNIYSLNFHYSNRFTVIDFSYTIQYGFTKYYFINIILVYNIIKLIQS